MEQTGDVIRNAIFVEAKENTKPRVAIKENYFNAQVIGKDHQWQKEMVNRLGFNYMSYQILSSLLLNCHYIGIAGSARLFSVLPIKAIVLSDYNAHPTLEHIMRGFAIARYGKEKGMRLPIVIANHTDETTVDIFDEYHVQEIEKLLPLETNVQVVAWDATKSQLRLKKHL
jgi:pyruvate/2-oxoglutarate/acetoin dehydrogenase E1 component